MVPVTQEGLTFGNGVTMTEYSPEEKLLKFNNGDYLKNTEVLTQYNSNVAIGYDAWITGYKGEVTEVTESRSISNGGTASFQIPNVDLMKGLSIKYTVNISGSYSQLDYILKVTLPPEGIYFAKYIISDGSGTTWTDGEIYSGGSLLINRDASISRREFTTSISIYRIA